MPRGSPGAPGAAGLAGPDGWSTDPAGAPSWPLALGGRLGIVDYGMGNLASVERAVRHVAPSVAVRRLSRPAELEGQDALILPGVGAFDAAVRNLRETGLDEALRAHLSDGRPLLGICLGFQLLFETSEESPPGSPYGRGLGWLAGHVRRFPPSFPVPHMGWNSLELTGAPSPLFEGIGSGSYVYFAHSYFPEVDGPGSAGCGWVAAYTRAGRADGASQTVRFASAAWRQTAGGVQFHPEKSGPVGLTILANFMRWALTTGGR